MISIIESLAQEENESRSDNIKWGIKQRAANGNSKLYERKCYGYKHNTNGNLIIVDAEAKIWTTYHKIGKIDVLELALKAQFDIE